VEGKVALHPDIVLRTLGAVDEVTECCNLGFNGLVLYAQFGEYTVLWKKTRGFWIGLDEPQHHRGHRKLSFVVVVRERSSASNTYW
jgi:hypothetical protein